MKSRKYKYAIIAILCFLPSVVYFVFDPAYGIFISPVIYVLDLICCLIAWIILRACKISEGNRLRLIITGIIIWSIYLGISTRHTYTSEGRFERLLIDPIPDSVRFIDSHGRIPLAGGYEYVVFTINPKDLEYVLKRKAFKTFKLTTNYVDSLEKRICDIARSYDIKPVHIYRAGYDFDFTMILSNETRNKVLVYCFKL